MLYGIDRCFLIIIIFSSEKKTEFENKSKQSVLQSVHIKRAILFVIVNTMNEVNSKVAMYIHFAFFKQLVKHRIFVLIETIPPNI